MQESLHAVIAYEIILKRDLVTTIMHHNVSTVDHLWIVQLR